jgi:drug/metabolite transporter (DMT)-like permease
MTILFVSVGQIAQKVAAVQLRRPNDLRSVPIRAISNGAIWVAVSCLTFGTLFWLLVLTQLEVSKAYPMLSLSFVVTAGIARLFLAERVSPRRWLGVLLIAAGASIMALS